MSATKLGIDNMLGEMRDVTNIIAMTALRYRGDGAERIYSSHPDLFADSGFKRFADAPSMVHVRDANAPVLTNGPDALRAGFPDWQKIVDCGCDAILNIRVQSPSGDVLGQLNLMSQAEHFSSGSITRLQQIADKNASNFMGKTSKEML